MGYFLSSESEVGFQMSPRSKSSVLITGVISAAGVSPSRVLGAASVVGVSELSISNAK